MWLFCARFLTYLPHIMTSFLVFFLCFPEVLVGAGSGPGPGPGCPIRNGEKKKMAISPKNGDMAILMAITFFQKILRKMAFLGDNVFALALKKKQKKAKWR